MDVYQLPTKQKNKLQSCELSIAAQENTTQIELPNWIDKLFLRFTAIYRSKWTADLICDELILTAKFEWAQALKKFDETVIMDTIEHCKVTYPFPPSISEFVSIAKDKASVYQNDIAIKERLTNRLELKEGSDNEHAKKVLDTVLALVKLKAIR